MVTNHVYNKEHNTTEVNIELAAVKLPAYFSCVPSVCVCASAGYSNNLQEYEANHYINNPYNQLK